MWESRIILTEFVAERVERFFRLALTGHDSKRPIHHFVAAGKPFVCPGKQNRPG